MKDDQFTAREGQMSCDGHGRKSSQQERDGFIKRANQIYFCLRIEKYLIRSLRIWLNLIAAALFTAALHAQAAAAAPAAKIDLTGLVPACPAFAKALFTGAAADKCEITAFGSVDTDTDSLIYELYSDAGGDNAIVLIKPDMPSTPPAGDAAAQVDKAPATGSIIFSEAGEDRYDVPAFYENESVSLLVVPKVEPTDVMSSADLVFRVQDGKLTAVADPFEWVEQLGNSPSVHGTIEANRSPDYDKMTGTVSLYGGNDPVCCPTGTVTATLVLKGNAIVLGRIMSIRQPKP